MKRNYVFAVSLAALIQPVTAGAEGFFTGSLNAGYSFGNASIDDASADLNTASLLGNVTLNFSDNLALDLGFTAMRLDLEDSLENIDLMGIDAAATYRFDNGFTAGAFFESGSLNIDTDIDGLDLLSDEKPRHKSYGLSLGYETANLDIEGFVGTTKIDPLDDVLDYDVVNFGINARYEFGDALTVGGHFTRSNVDINTGTGISSHAQSIGAAVFYDINDRMTAFGALSRVGFDDFNVDVDLTTYSLGMGYTLPGDSMLPVTLSAELVRNDLSLSAPGLDTNLDFNEFRVGVTIPLGQTNARRAISSHAQQTIDGHHDVISAILPLY